MKRVKSFVNRNYKVVIGIIIGITISIGIGVSAVATKDITYDNSKSGLTSTNMQGAIDELYEKTEETYNRNIVGAYTYNESSCLEYNSKCVKNTCYKTRTAGSCKAGTLIRYKVNNSTTRTFYVLHDDGNTITMQDSNNILDGIAWETNNVNTNGPTNALSKLESAVSGWTNVNEQTYASGYTNFKTSAYTGCSAYNSCTSNKYTLSSRTGKARMITVQEAVAIGCIGESYTCPAWMTVNLDIGYWTMNAYTDNNSQAWNVYYSGGVFKNNSVNRVNYNGIRAVVVISK